MEYMRGWGRWSIRGGGAGGVYEGVGQMEHMRKEGQPNEIRIEQRQRWRKEEEHMGMGKEGLWRSRGCPIGHGD